MGLVRMLVLATVFLFGCSTDASPEGGLRELTEPFSDVKWNCWPLPAQTVPDFPVLAQTLARSGEPPRGRVLLTYQVFGSSAEDADHSLRRTLLAAEFSPAPGREGWLGFMNSDFGTVFLRVSPFAAPDLPVTSILELDLPRSALKLAARGVCPTKNSPVGGRP